MRSGGFRPIVFLPHGLWLAFFMVNAAVAAASFARSEPKDERWKYLMATFYLMAIIVLCKSMGSLVYSVLLVPFVLMFSEKARVRLALVFVSLALIYPALRYAGMIPLDSIIDTITSISADRAQSLDYRFENEQLLLAHAHERLMFGWGGWGRNLLYTEWDGKMMTVPDGRWILIVGIFGIVGYIGEFGLLATPVLLLWLRMRRNDDITGAGTLAVLLGITMFDMLINAPLVPYVWMIAGAVIGRAELLRTTVEKEQVVHDDSGRTVLGRHMPSGGPRSVL
jgi:4-amino-4-deoxy-L-arabinose transferase-like glycosyltransferase